MGSWTNWVGGNIKSDFSGDTVKPPETPKAPEKAPTLDDPEVRKKKRATLLTQTLAQGRKSTFLTSARGIESKKTLGE